MAQKKEKATIVVTVGKAIARERKAAKMTQEKLAQAVGVEKETISRFETGDIAPTLERLEQLGTALSCPLRRFLWTEVGDAPIFNDTIIDMLSSLPKERQELVVRLVGDLTRILQEK